MASGQVTLTFRSEDLQPLSQAVLVFDASRSEALWLPAARVGVPYQSALPTGSTGYRLTAGALPPGLSLDGARGVISGTPTQALHARMQVAGDAAGTATIWQTDLSVFPATEMPERTLDQMNADGPFTVGALDETVVVASRNRSEKVRVYYPQTGGQVAAGKFPVVVFHHGAANTAPDPSPFSTIYLRYDPLLKRWASHGFVVATIDGVDTIVSGGRGTGLTLMNLTSMSENQRATIAHLRRRNGEEGWPLASHLDGDRVVVAGHSRGGGASLITTAADPTVMAAILLKPVDPLMSPGGETQWSRKLPARPMLITIASDDGDVTYPICDFLFERRNSVQSGPHHHRHRPQLHPGLLADHLRSGGAHPSAHHPRAGLGHHQRLRHRLPQVRGPGRPQLRPAGVRQRRSVHRAVTAGRAGAGRPGRRRAGGRRLPGRRRGQERPGPAHLGHRLHAGGGRALDGQRGGAADPHVAPAHAVRAGRQPGLLEGAHD
jgi:dienelactone hydrolase